VELSKKGKKGKGGRMVKKERDSGYAGGRLQPPFRDQEQTWEELLLSTAFQVVTAESWSQT
jgi:hypothetical protein